MKPLQPVDGREAGLGVVEGEKLSVHEPPGVPLAFFGSRLGFESGGMRAAKRARVATSGHGSVVPTARMSFSRTCKTGMPEDVSKRRPRTTASSTARTPRQKRWKRQNPEGMTRRGFALTNDRCSSAD